MLHFLRRSIRPAADFALIFCLSHTAFGIRGYDFLVCDPCHKRGGTDTEPVPPTSVRNQWGKMRLK